ncbi:unnamed protein product [Thlaspi arvense]|uniref:MATH domain-containing protein n=1 Tax=Thlaspi arvense TaxID=13288 RepID=A0AAU9SU24_THLAR|nr:unnamed protein product [Thlaspi arvense]
MGRTRSEDNRFYWMIKDFSTLRSEIIYSDEFVIGGCKWGDRTRKYMSLFLEVADSKHLPCGWRRRTKIFLEVVNQRSNQLSVLKSKPKWFDQKTPAAGFVTMIPRSKLFDEEGFIENGDVMIGVTIIVYKVIGKVVELSEEEESENDSEEVSEKDSGEESEEGSEKESSEESITPLKKTKLNDDGDLLNDTRQVKESIDVNGFQVLPSQVDLVRRIFEKYPDMALEFRAKNQHLRTASMNVLLSLIETLCQSPQELSNEDLVEGESALAYVQDAGFKVDWLGEKLEEMKEKKKEERSGETQIQELEEEIKNIRQKVLAARVSLTLDDFF